MRITEGYACDRCTNLIGVPQILILRLFLASSAMMMSCNHSEICTHTNARVRTRAHTHTSTRAPACARIHKHIASPISPHRHSSNYVTNNYVTNVLLPHSPKLFASSFTLLLLAQTEPDPSSHPFSGPLSTSSSHQFPIFHHQFPLRPPTRLCSH